MSFLNKLFGGSSGKAASAEPVEHEGYLIRPAPIREKDGQFRVCGIISREVGGEVKEHRMIRADLFASADDAVEATLRKARQVIKEQGERIFS